MAVTGQSPYDRASWEAAAAYGPEPGGVAASTVARNLQLTRAVWLYPPHAAFAFAPFGALPIELGVPLLHLFVAAVAFVGTATAARATGLTGGPLALALTGAVVSQPFVISVRDGHPIGLLLLGATLAYLGLRRRRHWPLVAGAVLLSFKPQVAALFGVGVIATLVARRDWRGIALTLIALVAALAPAELIDPFPFSDVAAATGERLAADLSTLPALARDMGGGVLLTLLLALGLIAACAAAVRVTRGERRANAAFASLLLGSLAVSPYVHDYDLLLCVPAAFVAVGFGMRTRHELPIALGAAGILIVVPWLLFYWWPLAGQGDRIYLGGALGGVPVVFALMLAAAATWARGRESASARGPSPQEAVGLAT